MKFECATYSYFERLSHEGKLRQGTCVVGNRKEGKKEGSDNDASWENPKPYSSSSLKRKL